MSTQPRNVRIEHTLPALLLSDLEASYDRTQELVKRAGMGALRDHLREAGIQIALAIERYDLK